MFKGGFIQNLPKIYGLYTGGFLVFILLMAVLESAGVSAASIGIMFVAFTVLIYALIGYLSRTIQVDAYYVAGRQVPTVLMEWRQLLTGCQVHRSLQWPEVSILVAILTWHS